MEFWYIGWEIFFRIVALLIILQHCDQDDQDQF